MHIIIKYYLYIIIIKLVHNKHNQQSPFYDVLVATLSLFLIRSQFLADGASQEYNFPIIALLLPAIAKSGSAARMHNIFIPSYWHHPQTVILWSLPIIKESRKVPTACVFITNILQIKWWSSNQCDNQCKIFVQLMHRIMVWSNT